ESIVNGSDVLHLGYLHVAIQGQAGTAIKDDVVTDDGVGYRKNSLKRVPDDIAFDDIDRISAGPVHEDGRVGSVINDVIADDVAVRSDLDLDSVALRNARESAVNPILLDHRIVHDACGIIAADVHAFTRAPVNSGVVYVVAPDGHVIHAVSE